MCQIFILTFYLVSVWSSDTTRDKIDYKNLDSNPKVDSCVTQSVFRFQHIKKQECIPVGCVPSAAVAAGDMYPSMHWTGGGVCPGGWGVCKREVCPGGSVCHAPLWTEQQMAVKTLPCPNYVADGKYYNTTNLHNVLFKSQHSRL